MNRRCRIAIFGLAVIVPGIVTWQVLSRREPVYNGKAESLWISSLSKPLPAGRDVREWQSLGADAVPLLLKVVEAKEGPIQVAYGKVWPKTPLFLQRWCPQPVNRSWPRQNALYLLRELAEHTPVPTGPILRALQDNDPQVRMAAASCLIPLTSAVNRGEEKAAVARALIQAFQANTNYAARTAFDAGMRNNLVIALGGCSDQTAIAVPVLLQALQDPDKHVREVATNALRRIEPKAAASAGVN